MKGFKVEGLRDLERSLGVMKQATARNTIRRAEMDALQPMAEVARRLAPDDPSTPDPDLESSIKVSAQASGVRRSGRGPVEAYMGPTKEGYPAAIMQEGGTRHHAAQPFMRPAWDGGKERLLHDYTAAMTDQIDKTAKRAARRAAKAAGA